MKSRTAEDEEESKNKMLTDIQEININNKILNDLDIKEEENE
jgi:hypothetical protein